MTIPRPRAGLALFAFYLGGAVLTWGASSHKVTLPADLLVSGVKLKSGEYNVSVEGKNAVFTRDKKSISIPVDVEKNSDKFSRTTLEIIGTTLHVINLGGTDTMLVFEPPH
jgi:hypothetical protein